MRRNDYGKRAKISLEEGRFSFELFDHFLDLAEEEHMKVIFGTPTAVPPVWLTEKYPEVLNSRKDGVLFRHGMRRHYNYNSKTLHRLASQIVEKVAEHYGSNGMFGNLDNHRMMDTCLDVCTYDSYPNFAYCLNENPKENQTLNDRKWSRNLAEVRSICPHFGIMEQQSGANGWNTRKGAPAPKPGQMTLHFI